MGEFDMTQLTEYPNPQKKNDEIFGHFWNHFDRNVAPNLPFFWGGGGHIGLTVNFQLDDTYAKLI